MDISKTLFATMVKNARMDRHWTQEELAEKLGVSPTYLGDLERHKGTPSLSLFCKAMRLLNLSADDYVYPKTFCSHLHIGDYSKMRLFHSILRFPYRYSFRSRHFLPCCYIFIVAIL